MRKFFFFLFALPCLLFSATPTVVENDQIMAYVQTLPHKGALKQTKEGFVYIEVPKEYVFNVIPMIPSPRPLPPPYFEKGLVGAHITVASAKEIADLGFPKIPRLGEKIPFKILDFARVDIESSMGSTVYMFEVDARLIAEIRKQLGLPPQIRDFGFHITVGVVK